MPPKKRVAEGEESTNGGATSTDLRRSTRGGGHKAAEPVSKPAKAPASKSKKAKTETAAKDGDDSNKTVVGEDNEKKNGDDKPAEVEEPAATTDNADKIVADAEKDAEKTGVEVPEGNKEAAEAKGGKRIEVGETIPEGIVLKNEKDEDVNISDITKEKGAVLFVYPKANTPFVFEVVLPKPVCTETITKSLPPLGYEVYGLSSDSPKAQSSWKEKNNFQYSFLCDPGQILLKLLGASKGPKSNQRSHYIIAKGGKLVDAKYTVSPKDSVKLALEYIKSQQ